jgi:hypothetical protein
MCGSDIFLAILAIFFPPVSGEYIYSLTSAAYPAEIPTA